MQESDIRTIYKEVYHAKITTTNILVKEVGGQFTLFTIIVEEPLNCVSSERKKLICFP